MAKIRLIKKRVNRSLWGSTLMFLLLAAMASFIALPVVYTISGAFKPLNEHLKFPPTLFPQKLTLNNFSDLFYLLETTMVPFSRYLYNTFFITIVGTILCVFIGALAAYPLSKMPDLPAKKALNWIVITAMMLSTDVSGLTNFILLSKFKMMDTYLSIIVPAIATSFNVFVIKQFMDQMVHPSLLDAARIDGANEFKIWANIVLPIIKPALLTVTIFSVQSFWNNAGTYLYTEEKKVLQFALAQLVKGGIMRSGVSAAISVIMLIVPVTVFIITQSNVVETMATSGIKE